MRSCTTRSTAGFFFAAGVVSGLGCSSSSGVPTSSGSQDAATVPTEAGSADAGARGSGGGEPDGSCAGTFVCDDFEKYPIGNAPYAPWTVSTSSGSVLIDTTRAHSGTQSVMVTAPATTGFRSALLRFKSPTLLPAPGNVVFGRMMFWLDSAPTAEVHWTFIDGEGVVANDAGPAYHAVSRYGGQMPLTGLDGGFGGSQMMASYDTPDPLGPLSDCYKHSQSEAVPVAQWSCAEWEFDGANNAMHFWLNGVALPDLTVAMIGDGCVRQANDYVWEAPAYSQLDVGWESYQADDARTIWIDDVAMGPARIGCP